MKNIILILLISVAFANCKSVESHQVSDSNVKTELNSVKTEPTPTAKKPLADLTKEQQQKLDEKIPPKIREILDKADEINIYYNIDKETKEPRLLMFKNVPNAVARITDSSLKKEFLESFYYDASSKELGAGCFAPRHRVKAEYMNKSVEMDVCYQCKNFRGKSLYGSFGGGFAYENKSSLIINGIIEKYGVELQ